MPPHCFALPTATLPHRLPHHCHRRLRTRAAQTLRTRAKRFARRHLRLSVRVGMRTAGQGAVGTHFRICGDNGLAFLADMGPC